MRDYRTALGRARGLGSAKHGVGHFIGQRVSAVALIFLLLWGVASALSLSGGGYAHARLWLASPEDAVLLVLLAITGFFHTRIGMAVIIEDYIGRPATKAALLILNTFICWGGMALTVICLLKVAFGGSV